MSPSPHAVQATAPAARPLREICADLQREADASLLWRPFFLLLAALFTRLDTLLQRWRDGLLTVPDAATRPHTPRPARDPLPRDGSDPRRAPRHTHARIHPTPATPHLSGTPGHHCGAPAAHPRAPANPRVPSRLCPTRRIDRYPKSA